jgi:aspartate/methionine/tyrosine aminotransferase
MMEHVISERAKHMAPFRVMQILDRARQMEAQGRDIIHMEIGEPDFPSPPTIIAAGMAALRAGQTHYTAANGLPELRAAISRIYRDEADIDPDQIMISPGASGALQLAMAVLLNPGDGIMMTDPGYPCNRHIASLYNATVQSVPVDEQTGYQLTRSLLEKHWQSNTRVVLVASPSNPTGTLIEADELADISRFVLEKNARLIVDEIYHGLVYDRAAASAAGISDDIFVINSFSKYYGMTGWRIGWLVMPAYYIEAVNRLAQNMFLAAPTLSQHAALAALSPDTAGELARRRDVFQQRRDFLLPELQAAGFAIHTEPRGAFYIYADCSGLQVDAETLCANLLEVAGVAVTPGSDFGSYHSDRYVRFSYANTLENLQLGMQRIHSYLENPA